MNYYSSSFTSRLLSFLMDISGSTKPIRSKQFTKSSQQKSDNVVNQSQNSENKEFISYNDIKSIFDKIDEKYSPFNSVPTNHHILKNCEINSPVMENQNDDVVALTQGVVSPPLFINMALSFCIQAEAYSDLKNESNYVLLSDYMRDGDERVFDEEFEVL